MNEQKKPNFLTDEDLHYLNGKPPSLRKVLGAALQVKNAVVGYAVAGLLRLTWDRKDPHW